MTRTMFFRILAVLLTVASSTALADERDVAKKPWTPKPGDWVTAFGNFQNTGYVNAPKCVPPFHLK